MKFNQNGGARRIAGDGNDGWSSITATGMSRIDHNDTIAIDKSAVMIHDIGGTYSGDVTMAVIKNRRRNLQWLLWSDTRAEN